MSDAKTDDVSAVDLLAQIEKAKAQFSEPMNSLEALDDAIKSRSQRQAATSGSKDKSYDWTKVYQTWDQWAELEELKAKKEKLQLQQEQARKKQAQNIGGCSHDHEAERTLYEKSFDVKIEQCHEFRLEGNAWFEEGQYYRALKKYDKVITWLDYTFAKTPEQREEMATVNLAVLLNMAVCQLKLKQYSKVIQSCKQALRIKPDTAKALFCRAKASRFLDDFTTAEQDIRRVLELLPNSSEVRCEYALLRNKIRRYKADTALRAKAMMGGLGSGEQTVKHHIEQATEMRFERDLLQPPTDEDADAEFEFTEE